MQSDSLMRLQVEQPPKRQYGNQVARDEIAADVDAFLAGGGEIHRVGSELNARPTFNPRNFEQSRMIPKR